jgi:hypothetical protein
LNKTPPVLVGSGPNRSENLEQLKAILDKRPSGRTPICRHVRAVIEQFRKIESGLIQNDQTALMIILTDGESSDGDVVNVLRHFENRPNMHVVIRVATKDKAIVEYWHNVSSQLNANITILDNLKDAARGSQQSNAWLTYCEPIHRLREFGIAQPEIDVLDQRRLSRKEIKAITELM